MNKKNIKELRQLADKFKEKEANPAGLPAGTTALRADVAYLWVLRFIDFVNEETEENINS